MKRLLILLVLIITIILPFGCTVYDGPPKTDLPLPNPLNGEYVSPHGTFIFNGDGKSIIVTVDDLLAEATGLPIGESEGTYVFLLSNGMYRYDLSEYMQISLENTTVRLNNSYGVTNESAIVLRVSIDESDTVTFTRK